MPPPESGTITENTTDRWMDVAVVLLMVILIASAIILGVS
jgi:hypothetical protein